jgi:hypothetical protein
MRKLNCENQVAEFGKTSGINFSRKIVFVPGIAAAATLLVFMTGCVTKSTAQARAREAYLAGQRDAMASVLEQKSGQTNSVTFIGPVNHPIVPWSEGLTLAKAILSAVYNSQTDPAMIIIRRPTEQIQVDPKRLLDGGDFPLKPGDVIQFQLPGMNQSQR